MWLRRLLLAVFTILSEEDYFFHHTKQNVKQKESTFNAIQCNTIQCNISSSNFVFLELIYNMIQIQN